MNKKQKEDELLDAAEVCDLIEFQIANAIKVRVSQLSDEEFRDDELCNLLFNISRQASVLDYKLTKALGD